MIALKSFQQIFRAYNQSILFSCIFKFSKPRLKQSQIILHPQTTIEKMHLTRNNKKAKQKEQWQKVNQKNSETYVVSIVGLPNCGKSTLFNSLVGERLAIVDKLAGLTRDRKQYNILDGLIRFIDTPGVQLSLDRKKSQQKLKEDIFMQTIHSLHQSSLILFVVDCKNPISNNQVQFSKYLKTFGSSHQVILVGNKFDGAVDQEYIMNDITKLGFKNIFLCSGEHGIGVLDLLNYIHSLVPLEIKQQHQRKKKQRKEKYQKIILKMKQQLEQLKAAKGIKINLRQWEKDFRKINPQPQSNLDLDFEDNEKYFIKPQEIFSNTRGVSIQNLKMKNSIKICFIGRPNVGKSSLINQILGEERLVVSQVPHTTRDSITSKIIYKDRKIQLTDTAGLNTPNLDRNNEQYLKKVQISTMLQVKQSHVVVYVMDAFSSFQINDFKLIQSIIKEGRPLIIAINKWESIKQQYKYKAKNFLMKQISQNLGQLNGFPLVFISAKMRIGMTEMMDKIILTYDKWNTRISTGLLNDWLSKFKKLDNLPKKDDHNLKITYLIQARVRPPLFILFVNSKKLFKDNYMRFLTQNFAKQFQMDGIPIRTILRSSNNNQNKIKKSRPQKISKINIKMQELKKKYNDFKK